MIGKFLSKSIHITSSPRKPLLVVLTANFSKSQVAVKCNHSPDHQLRYYKLKTSVKIPENLIFLNLFLGKYLFFSYIKEIN